jgi:hypothetical protein
VHELAVFARDADSMLAALDVDGRWYEVCRWA